MYASKAISNLDTQLHALAQHTYVMRFLHILGTYIWVHRYVVICVHTYGYIHKCFMRTCIYKCVHMCTFIVNQSIETERHLVGNSSCIMLKRGNVIICKIKDKKLPRYRNFNFYNWFLGLEKVSLEERRKRFKKGQWQKIVWKWFLQKVQVIIHNWAWKEEARKSSG
jgi:hypothetical protein